MNPIVKLILDKRIKGVYNVIGGDFLTIKQLVSLCERVFDYCFDVQYEIQQPIENIDKVDDSKLRKQVNYFLQHDIEGYLRGELR